MHKFLALAAVTASALLVTSANAAVANADDQLSVRISVAGKTTDQVQDEIRVAAKTVCGRADFECYDQAVANAERQFYAMRHPASEEAKVVPTALDEPLTVRVPVAGKTRDQLLQDIDAAAHTVCQPMVHVESDYQACVNHALSNARDQMRHMTMASADTVKLAQN